MARINVDDDIESRDEFRKLVKILNGDDDKARGMLIRFWRIAQEYWGERKLVPMEDIEFADLQPILESRWGIVEPEPKPEWELVGFQSGWVYAIGSEARFDWYRQRCDASKKGVEVRKRNKQRSDQPEQDLGQPEQDLGQPEQDPGQPEQDPGQPEQNSDEPEIEGRSTGGRKSNNPLSLSPSLTLSLKNKETKGADAPQGQQSLLPEERPGKDPDIPRFIASYVSSYQARYSDQTRPDLRGKVLGQIKNLLKDIPVERACNLIQVYCQMEDPWFVKKHHDFGTFVENLNKVSCALDTGTETGSIDWGEVFGGDSK